MAGRDLVHAAQPKQRTGRRESGAQNVNERISFRRPPYVLRPGRRGVDLNELFLRWGAGGGWSGRAGTRRCNWIAAGQASTLMRSEADEERRCDRDDAVADNHGRRIVLWWAMGGWTGGGDGCTAAGRVCMSTR